MATKAQQAAINHLMTKHGIPEFAAVGIVGGLSGESGVNLQTNARNKGDGRDGSDSVGIAQWNSDRVTRGSEFLGKPLHEATGYEQLDYLVHELKTTESKAFNKMRQADNAFDVTRAFVKHFERPADPNAGDVRAEKYTAKLAGQSYEPSAQSSTPETMSAQEQFRQQQEQTRSREKQVASLDAGFKSWASSQGVSANELVKDANRLAQYQAIYQQSLKQDANIKLETNDQLLNNANPVLVAGDKLGRSVEKLFSSDPNAVDKRRDTNLTEMSRGGMAVASGVSNAIGNIGDVLDNTSVGNYLGVDNTPNAIKQSSIDIDKMYDDGSTGYKIARTVGEIAPALAVPMIGAPAGIGLMSRGAYLAGNSALQAGSAYITSDDDVRGQNAGIAGAITAAIPVVGKTFKTVGEIAKVGDKLNAEKVAGNALKNVINDPEAIARLNSYNTKLSPIDNAVDTTGMILNKPAYNSLMEGIRSQVGAGSKSAVVKGENATAIRNVVNPERIGINDAVQTAGPQIKSALKQAIDDTKDLARVEYKAPAYQEATVMSDDLMPKVNELIKTRFTNSAGKYDGINEVDNIVSKLTPDANTAIKLSELDDMVRSLGETADTLVKNGEGLKGSKLFGVRNEIKDMLQTVPVDDAALTAKKAGDKLWKQAKTVEKSALNRAISSETSDDGINVARSLFTGDRGRSILNNDVTKKLINDGVVDKKLIEDVSRAQIDSKLFPQGNDGLNITAGNKALGANKRELADLWGAADDGTPIVDKVTKQLELETIARKTQSVAGSNTANKLAVMNDIIADVEKTLSNAAFGAGVVTKNPLIGMAARLKKDDFIKALKSNVANLLDEADVDPKLAKELISKAEKAGMFAKFGERLMKTGQKMINANSQGSAVAISTGLFDD